MKENQAVEFLPIDSVAPYPRNPRTHPEANVTKLVASIKEFGWTTPILVDEENAILAGHGRLLAARALLMPKVPCLRIPGLSSAQKRAYRLADNRLTLDSDWDFEALRLELANLDCDLALTGFNEAELASILALNGDDPNQEWLEMPEFDQQDQTAFRSIMVHFKDQNAVDDFAIRLKANITENTKFIWFPHVERTVHDDKRWSSQE